MRNEGFTLVEVLVAMGVSAAFIAVMAMATAHVQRAVERGNRSTPIAIARMGLAAARGPIDAANCIASPRPGYENDLMLVASGAELDDGCAPLAGESARYVAVRNSAAGALSACVVEAASSPAAAVKRCDEGGLWLPLVPGSVYVTADDHGRLFRRSADENRVELAARVKWRGDQTPFETWRAVFVTQGALR